MQELYCRVHDSGILITVKEKLNLSINLEFGAVLVSHRWFFRLWVIFLEQFVDDIEILAQ